MSKQLKYSPQTGMFYRFSKPVRATSTHGYRKITYDRKTWAAHRLAWVLVYGQIPAGMEIDHVNRKRLDNRICNLRLVTHLENMRNASHYQGNVYVSLNSTENRRKPWRVYTTASKYLGAFATQQEAEEFANLKRKELSHGI